MSSFEDHIQRLKQDPASDTLAEALRKLAFEEDELEAYARACQERGEALQGTDPERALSALSEAAQLFEEQLGMPVEAASAWEAVLALDEGNRQALFSLSLLFHDLKRPKALIALYRRRLALSEDPSEQASLHLYIAEILSEQLKNPSGAFEEVVAAARLRPSNLHIVSRLQELGFEAGRISEVALTIGNLSMHQHDPKIRAALSLRLAELHLGPLEDEARALVYLKAALADDGGNPELLQQVEDVFKEQERFEDLAQLLEESTTERRVGPHWVRLRRELARMLEFELNDPVRAMRVIMRALELAPEDRELLDEVARLGQATGQYALLAKAYELALSQTDRPLLKTFLRLKLGQLYKKALNQPDEAKRVYWAILKDAPEHQGARNRLLAIYEDGHDPRRLADLLEMEARALRPKKARLLWMRLIQIYAEDLKDEAAEALARAHLEGAVPQTFDLPDYPALPREMPDEEALPQIRWPGDPPQAPLSDLESEALVTPMPGLSDAFIKRPLVPRPDFTPDVPRMLPPKSGAPTPVPAGPPSLTLVTGPPEPSRSEGASSPIFLMATPSAKATPQAGSVPPPLAVTQATSESRSPMMPPAGEVPAPQVERSLGAVGAPGASSKSAESAKSTPAAAAAPVTPSKFEESAAGAPGTPSKSAESAESAKSTPVAAAAPGMPSKFEESAKSAAAAPVTSSKSVESAKSAPIAPVVPSKSVEFTPTPETSPHSTLHQIIDRFDRLINAQLQSGRMDDALRSAAELLRVAPSLENLISLLGLGREADPELAVRLADPICVLQPPGAQEAWHLALAAYEREVLGDLPAAVGRLSALYTQNPDSEPVFEAYLSVLDDQAHFARGATLLSQRAESTRDVRKAETYARRAAERWADHLEAPERGFATLKSLLERAPELTELRAHAARLLTRAGMYPELIQLLEDGLAGVQGPELSQTRLRISRIQGDALDDPEAAIQTLKLGLEERARDPLLLRALMDRYRDLGRDEAYVEAGLQLLERPLPPAEARALRRELGLCMALKLGEADAAVELLSEIAGPGADMELLETLEACQRRLEDWPALNQTLSDQIQAAETPEVAEAARLRRAALAISLGQSEAAQSDLKAVLSVFPEHPEALQALGDLELSEGNRSSALRRFRSLTPQLEGEARILMLLRVADMEESEGDAKAALLALDAAIALAPQDARAVLARFELEDRLQGAQRYALAVQAAQLTEDPVESARLWCRAALIAPPEDEARLIETAKQLAPDDIEVKQAYALLVAKSDDPEAAFPLFEEAAALATPKMALSLHLEAADLARHLGQSDREIAQLEAALSLFPTEAEPLQRLAQAAGLRGDPERAYALSASLLLHHEDKLSAAEQAQVYVWMSRAKRGLGELDAADRLAKTAMQRAPENPAAWQALAEVCQQAGDLPGAVSALQEAAERCEPASKAACLVTAARLQAELAAEASLESSPQDGAPTEASVIALLEAAQEARPSDPSAAELLVKHQLAAGRPSEAAKAWARLAHSQAIPQRGHLLRRAADLLDLGGPDRPLALQLLSEAIFSGASDPDRCEALAAHYRLDGDLDALLGFESALAEAGLQRPDALRNARDLAFYERFDAKQALVFCQKLRDLALATPEDLTIEAEVLSQRASDASGSDTEARAAIAAWGRLLSRYPGDAKALIAMKEAAEQGGLTLFSRHLDDLFVELGLASQPPDTHFEGEPLRVGALPVSPEEAGGDVELLDQLGYAIYIHTRSERAEALQPRRRDLAKPKHLPERLSEALEAAAQSLGMSVPPVYLRSDAAMAIQPTLAEQPALVVSIEACQNLNPAALRHLSARSMSRLRPRALALSSVSTDLLRQALIGIAQVEQPEIYGADPRKARRWGKLLSRSLEAADRETVEAQAQRWLSEENRRSLSRARLAIYETAARAGLFASGRLRLSIQLESQLRNEEGALALLNYASSWEFLQTRLEF